ncbi:MAG TPA: branched-chain amino acid ABC transporter permease [Candidatus Cybelea sp.]|nr:branched-chain amino acid ABC transporter permease [Candidatus Cybelea sp.]
MPPSAKRQWSPDRAFPRRAGFAASIALAAMLPFVLGGFATYTLTFAGIYAIAVIGLNLLIGYNGQFSLGHSAFYALGGYTTAILSNRLGIPAYATFPASAVVGFLAGVAIGYPASRLEFIYLALTTFALSLVVPQVLKSSWLEGITGGVQGLYLDRPQVPAGLPLSPDEWWYFVTAATLLVMWWLARNLVNGRFGRAMIAVRDDPIAAAAMGIQVARCKAITFGLSAACAAVAGSLGALMMEFIAPDTFTFFFAITLLVGSVIGGAESISGAVLGGLFLVYMPRIANDISKNLTWPVYGIMLILTVWILPNGAVGLLRMISERAARRQD